MMKTHDLSDRSWGNNYNVLDISEGGSKVRLCGWSLNIKAGDYLLLKQGDGTTRYLVDKIEYTGSPSDMWFADTSFAPREY